MKRLAAEDSISNGHPSTARGWERRLLRRPVDQTRLASPRESEFFRDQTRVGSFFVSDRLTQKPRYLEWNLERTVLRGRPFYRKLSVNCGRLYIYIDNKFS